MIETEWDFMTTDNCIPVKVALELMDPSSLGKAHMYDSFRFTHKELQQALQSIVNGEAELPKPHWIAAEGKPS